MNNIDIPIVFLNSLDDPVVPPELQDIPLDYVMKSPNALHVITQVRLFVAHFKLAFDILSSLAHCVFCHAHSISLSLVSTIESVPISTLFFVVLENHMDSRYQ